ncbi:carbohydrate ABC transporter permease [Paenibacillus sp. MBLB4367]|uniref:carbohydrate ABC transporter permease n=1 Tax=Paenibacillus sp. MBLB4367 TaxID=3384767 RepID=UPI00390824EE
MVKQTSGEKLFHTANHVFMTVLGLSMLFPFVHILAKSLSDDSYVLAKEVTLLPKGFHLGSFEYVLNNKQYLLSFGNSVFITVVGTLLSMIITIMAAYPLSKQGMPGKRVIMLLYVITMFFSGGIVPTYLVVRELALTNTLWSLIWPTVLVPFNLILLRSFFSSIPEALEESAKMDGATHTRTLISIYLPLSLPSIATVSMFYAVMYWNNFFNALMYITDRKLIPLQVYLMQIIQDESNVSMSDVEALMHSAPESIRAATIILAIVPILIVYPFVQRFFVQGVMLGAVKG